MQVRTASRILQKTILRRTAVILVTTAVFLSMFLMFIQLSEDSLIQSLTRLNNEFVEQVDTISGTLLEIIHNAAMQMFYSRSLTKLRTLETVTNAERVAGLRDLGSWVSSSTFLSSALIYNSQSDTMFTSGGGHVPNARETFPDPDTYELMASRTKHGFTGPIKRQAAEGEVYSFLFFEPNVPSSGSLLLNVRAHWFENQLLGLSSGFSSAVIDGQGEVLAASSPALAQKAEEIWPQLEARMAEGESHGFLLEPHGKSGWMYAQLPSLGLYYLRPFDTAGLLPGLTKVRSVALALLLIVSGVLAVGTLYTVFVLYPPVQAIRRALSKLGSGSGNVSQEMDRLVEKQMEQQLSEQVFRLLEGEDLPLVEYPAALVLVECPDLKAVRAVAEAATQNPLLVAAGSIGCLVLISTPSEQSVTELCLSLSWSLRCRCLYSTSKLSVAELKESHNRLLELWQMRFLYAGQQVLSEKLASSFEEPIEFSEKDIAPLLAALKAGDFAEAKATWRAIFDHISRAKYNDFRFFFRSILINLRPLQLELGLDPPEGAWQILDNLSDAAQLHQLMEETLAQITAAQQDRRRSNLQRLANQVEVRIAASYGDPTLSAHSIADEMGMNAVYLGRQFKEATGMSIADAIKKTRIETAMRLLRETDKPVREVAEQVGFSNDKYFFVVFKELVGMTPREFRSSIGQ